MIVNKAFKFYNLTNSNLFANFIFSINVTDGAKFIYIFYAFYCSLLPVLPFNVKFFSISCRKLSLYSHQSILPKGRYFTADSGTKAIVLFKGRSSSANSGTQAAVLVGMNRCGSFPLLSAPHSLFSIWTDLKGSQGHQLGGEESRSGYPGPPVFTKIHHRG